LRAPASEREAARWLLTPEAIREQCATIYEAGRSDRLEHFALAESRLEETAEFVLGVTRETYPDLEVPFHSRWRHFAAGGHDRWAAMRATIAETGDERARAAFDLTITSVLLDAGAGSRWRYQESKTGETFTRSEGLGVASLRAFEAGLFSAQHGKPLRADSAALARFDAGQLAAAFQAGPGNPLDGLEGRARLIGALGSAVSARPDLFGEERRLGNLFDHLKAKADQNALPAREILIAVLDAFGPIWPGRTSLGGIGLGDTWAHPAAVRGDAASGLVPFHKLSQWLSYSLVEPLIEAGIAVTGLDVLTGLAEYRNGGLFVDMGVLVARHGDVTARPHAPGDPVIVEWRALTVILLDRTAALIRERLGLDADHLPLAKVLEGGTWAAGRKLAAARRPGAGPPIAIVSDGSVF